MCAWQPTLVQGHISACFPCSACKQHPTKWFWLFDMPHNPDKRGERILGLTYRTSQPDGLICSMSKSVWIFPDNNFLLGKIIRMATAHPRRFGAVWLLLIWSSISDGHSSLLARHPGRCRHPKSPTWHPQPLCSKAGQMKYRTKEHSNRRKYYWIRFLQRYNIRCHSFHIASDHEAESLEFSRWRSSWVARKSWLEASISVRASLAVIEDTQIRMDASLEYRKPANVPSQILYQISNKRARLNSKAWSRISGHHWFEKRSFGMWEWWGVASSFKCSAGVQRTPTEYPTHENYFFTTPREIQWGKWQGKVNIT